MEKGKDAKKEKEEIKKYYEKIVEIDINKEYFEFLEKEREMGKKKKAGIEALIL